MDEGVVNYISETLDYGKASVKGQLVKMADGFKNIAFLGIGLYSGNDKICTLDGRT